MPSIPFRRDGAAGRLQRHRAGHRRRSCRAVDAVGPQCSLRYCRPLHTAVDTALQSRFSVTGHPLEWFRSYLSGRNQVFVVAQSRETPPVSMTSGVPQNCSLGPPQFISSTECSANIFSMHGVQYQLCADDSQSRDHCPVTIACNQCIMLTRLSSCVNDLASCIAPIEAEPHEIRVYLVRLTC